LKDPPFSLQTSLILQELSPRRPQWYFVGIFDKGRKRLSWGKPFCFRAVEFEQGGASCRCLGSGLMMGWLLSDPAKLRRNIFYSERLLISAESYAIINGNDPERKGRKG
ncbi:MAG: hypothetical protein PUH42_09635, partial [Firmicutes bacterium]|nr:hypothetical protein [Bacillota bacterium]